jgi:hypothetical protein
MGFSISVYLATLIPAVDNPTASFRLHVLRREFSPMSLAISFPPHVLNREVREGNIDHDPSHVMSFGRFRSEELVLTSLTFTSRTLRIRLDNIPGSGSQVWTYAYVVMDTRIWRMSCESNSRTRQVFPVAQIFDLIGPVDSSVEHLALDMGDVGLTFGS